VDLTGTEERIAAFSSLADPTRRRLYLFVVSRSEGAGRDEAAEAAGISRGLAAFHLDRLIVDGLLAAEYRRLTGRTGPGAGRPSKIYRRSARELSFSVPQRNHELLARLFAQAFSATDGNPLEALLAAANDLGATLGSEARRRVGSRAARDRLLEAASTVLEEQGFAPRAGDKEGKRCLVLGNCPFSPVAGEYMDFVCQANLALMQGLASGLQIKGVQPLLEREPGRCCVVFERVPRARPTGDASMRG
jgi:predicted ArsR family transcriptional regulator